MKQVFAASSVVVKGNPAEMVTLGDVRQSNDPVHGLVIGACEADDDHKIYLEFNDQANTCKRGIVIP